MKFGNINNSINLIYKKNENGFTYFRNIQFIYKNITNSAYKKS